MENQIINETTIDTGVNSDWYVDLTREEFIRFRLLLAKVNGPLRHRTSSFVMSLVCCVLLAGFALWEWWSVLECQGWPDPVMLVAAVLVMLPGLFAMFYVPSKMARTAAKQYDRSIEAGMCYCGKLVAGFFIKESIFKFFLPGSVFRKGISCNIFALGIQLN